jgi:threonine synthase
MAADLATASAPASIGNVGVGFDILGQAFDAARDTVTAVREDQPGVRLGEVTGLVTTLPSDPRANTALAAAQAVLDAAGAKFGARLSIDKGVPMAAGMGGSAASAVAGAAAANALLDKPFALEELLPFALEGERVASDPPHWDNVMASLLGGLVLAASEEPPLVQRLPAPEGVVAILLHPSVKVETKMARAILKAEVPMKLAVEHSRRVAAFVAGCATGDHELLRVGLVDLLVEPQREHLLPVLPAVRKAALEAGALGCSFSGSGPSIFAWVVEANVDAVQDAMSWAFVEAGIAARAYRAPVTSAGVRVRRRGGVRMRFVSTRGNAEATSLSEAIRNGAAPDGGLYMPDRLPALDGAEPNAPLAGFAARFLRPFFAGDALESELPKICSEAFDFPIPLVTPDPRQPGLEALELFHGPTGAFKDLGARFLMACFDRIGDPDKPLTILVATSGDTGGAVGCAAEGRRSVRAVILFPRGRVSAFQERQLTCWRDPVRALEVEGDFDDCQRLVKAAFSDQPLAAEHRLTSANSINFGRLLPQVAYVAQAALKVFARTGKKPGYIMPSGNLGHGFAVMLARAMGVPIGPVVLATNANRTLKDWDETGRYEPRPSIATLANAMDVGNPSNFERLNAMPEAQVEVRVELVDDDQIRARIKADYDSSGYVWCPHSATAAEAYARLSDEERSQRSWIVAATAHPYKFADVIEPVIGRTVEPTPPLAAILDRPVRKSSVSPDLDALAGALGEAEPVS